MSQLARNTFFLTFASIGQKAVAFLYFALIAQTIGKEATGAYFIALALTTSIGVIDDVGLTSVVIREVAKSKERARALLRNVMGIKMVTMPLTILLAFVLPPLLGFDPATAYLVHLAVFVMLLDTISVTFYGVLRGMHTLQYESLGIFVGQTITTIIGVTALMSGVQNQTMLIVALIFGSLWNAVFAAIHVGRRIGWGAFVPAWTETGKILGMASMFFLAAIFVKVYSYVDSFTLKAVLGNEAVGIYSVAYKLTYAFQFLPLAFVGALYPTLAAQVGDKKALKETLLNAEWYMALLAAPIVFGVFSLAPEIIGFFYGAEYAESGQVLAILIFVLLFIFLDFPLGALMNATGKQGLKTAIMGVTMIINIVSNLLLVPRLGIPGAAIAGLLSFVFMFAAGWFTVSRLAEVSLLELVKRVGGFMLAGALMAVVVLLVKEYVVWFAAIPVGAMVFFAISLLTRALTRDHVAQAKQLLKRKTGYVRGVATDV